MNLYVLKMDDRRINIDSVYRINNISDLKNNIDIPGSKHNLLVSGYSYFNHAFDIILSLS